MFNAMLWVRSLIKWFRGKVPHTPARAARKRRERPKEEFAAYYLGDLLDSLSQVFADYPAFSKLDPDAFCLYQKLGATVLTNRQLIARDLEPYALAAMPGFGCFYLHTPHIDDDADRVPARFMYFVKEKRPINVQPSNHTIYRCGLLHDFNGRPVGSQFYISVSELGEVVPLKALLKTKRGMPQKKRRAGERYLEVVRMEWRHSDALQGMAADWGRSVETAASEMFAIMVNGSLTREAGITVRARSGRSSAAFSIDMLRTPYFFADREKTVNENGQTKRILHIVRGHQRQVAGGDSKFIKSHFRGLREFRWNGYDVSIGLAGWHGAGLSEFDAGVVEERDTRGQATYGPDEVADRIDKITL